MRVAVEKEYDETSIRAREPIPILLYHSVSENPPAWLAPYSVRPQDFAMQMDLILDLGRTPLTVSGMLDAIEANRLPERPIVVTFDDGYLDFLTDAMPVLAGREIVATMYVTTGGLENSPDPAPLVIPSAKFIDWDSLCELDSLGIELGPHSHTHPQLDTLSFSNAAYEIEHSTELLADALGRFPRSFAYPHGYASRKVRDHVAAVGLESACGVREAFSYALDERFNLARLTVYRTTSFATMFAWINGRGAKLAPRHERPKTTAWRIYRRLQTNLAPSRLTASS